MFQLLMELSRNLCSLLIALVVVFIFLYSLPSFYSLKLLAPQFYLRLFCASCRVTVESRKGKSFCSNTHEVFKYCRSLTPAERTLMVEVIKLVKLLMTMPATNASSERAFNTQRYVKNYLRTTMFQERLNNLMVTYKDRL